MVKIRVNNALKVYGSGPNAVRVLDNVCLDIHEHEFITLVGPSGCGKTTLLNAIAGFLPLDGGSIDIDGKPVAGPSPRRIYVSQESSIFPWMTVEENIVFPLRGASPERRAEVAQRMLEWTELIDFRDAFPTQLSGGMKQRLEFARAMAAEPEVLLMDEPFGALDPFSRHGYCREVARLWSETKKTCVMVTHDIEEACALATRIVVMSARPARIVEVLDNPLPRPRDLKSPEFVRLKGHIQQLLQLDLSI